MTTGTPWFQKHGLSYALLRLAGDPRPLWARALGLRGCLVNGEELPLPPPRLRFRRRLGSFSAPPHAPAAFRESEDARYDQHLRELFALAA